MKNQMKCMFVVLVTIILSPSSTTAVTFDWAIIGNPGNPARMYWYGSNGYGYGSVAYEYSISATEVTNAQYMDFLNAVAKTDSHNLYNTNMGGLYGGISRSGSSGSYKYSLKNGDINFANRPVAYVSWYDTLRFANWLHNGQPTGLQTASTTEYGAYDMSQGASVVRLAGATYWLPSEDEWYKAAYYDPEKETYYTYATGTNTLPVRVNPEDDTGNSANYYEGDYLLGWPYYTTEVGAYDESASPYGTYDQNGNVYEWNEVLMGTRRGYRGGSWDNPASYFSPSLRMNLEADFEGSNVGFRIASFETSDDAEAIPEPLSIGLILLSLSGLLLRRTKRA